MRAPLVVARLLSVRMAGRNGVVAASVVVAAAARRAGFKAAKVKPLCKFVLEVVVILVPRTAVTGPKRPVGEVNMARSRTRRPS